MLDGKRPYLLPDFARYHLACHFQNSQCLCRTSSTHLLLAICIASEIEHLHSSLSSILHSQTNLDYPHTLHVHPGLFITAVDYTTPRISKDQLSQRNTLSLKVATSSSASSSAIFQSQPESSQSSNPPVALPQDLKEVIEKYSYMNISDIDHKDITSGHQDSAATAVIPKGSSQVDQNMWSYYKEFITFILNLAGLRFRLIQNDLYFHDTSSESSASPDKNSVSDESSNIKSSTFNCRES